MLKIFTVEELAVIVRQHEMWSSGADGQRADLSGAKLNWADLSRADLNWAKLSWADLSGADLSGADLSWLQAQGAKWPFRLFSVYGVGTLRVVHYRPDNDQVWAGCWTGNFEEFKAKLPRVCAEVGDTAAAEYAAVVSYFEALRVASATETNSSQH